MLPLCYATSNLILSFQNNATCVDGINDYTCNCFLGYGGKNCDQVGILSSVYYFEIFSSAYCLCFIFKASKKLNRKSLCIIKCSFQHFMIKLWGY